MGGRTLGRNRILVFMHAHSLLNLRGTERWLLEVASRLGNSIILTFSSDLSNIKDIREKVNEIKIRLREAKIKNVEWYELRALSHENMSNIIPKPIVRFMKHSDIIIPIDFRVCRLLRKKNSIFSC
jgi:hypothetical protein